MKINLTGAPTYRIGYLPLEDTHYTNPYVIAAVAHLMGKAGARRIRILESPWSTADPVEEYIMQGQLGAARHPGRRARTWSSKTPTIWARRRNIRAWWCRMAATSIPAFDLNHSYEDCDVFVSLAKMKEHATAGITLSMKNCFGLTPATIYGTGAGVDEPPSFPRRPDHGARRQSPALEERASGERPEHARGRTYRVPRTVVDLVSARPIHLAIVEGVKTMTGGEGPWIREELQPAAPGVIVAGTEPRDH